MPDGTSPYFRKAALSLLLGAGAFAALCWWFGLAGFAAALARLSPGLLVAYLGLSAAVVLGYSARWDLVGRAVGQRVAWRRLIGARLAGDAVGSLIPSAKLAGEPVRVALLHGDGVPGVQATAGVAIDRLLELLGNMLAVIAYTAVFAYARTRTAPGEAPLLLAGVMGVLLVATAMLLRTLRCGGRPLARLYDGRMRRAVPRAAAWLDGLRHVEEHLVRFFHHHPRTFLWGLLATVGIEVTIVAQYYVLLAAFGVSLDLPVLLLVLLGGGLSRAVPAPAGLGALEATQVAVVGLGTGQPELGFVVGLVVRAHELLLLAVGLAALAWQGTSLARLVASVAPVRKAA